MKKAMFMILALVILVSAISSCNNTADSIANEPQGTDIVATIKPEEEAPTVEMKLSKIVSELPKQNYDGYTFTVLDRSADLWSTQDVYSESLSGEPINDAVYERNQILEDTFNIKIVENKQKSPVAVAKTSILAGEDSYDLLTDGLSAFTSLVTSGYIMDYYKIPGINLSADWWDNNIVNGMSIGGKLYYATGDISIMDNYGTWAVMFNKGLIQDLNLDDPYKLVEDNKWLLSKMHEMCVAATADLNGDGVMGDEDRYGSGTEAFNVYAYWAASGQKIVTKDTNDLPELTIHNDKSVEIIEKVLEFQNDRSITTATNRRKDGLYNYQLFRDGFLLFGYTGMMTLSHYRGSDVDYGLITVPKYSESQEEYCNTFSPYNFTAYAVPNTAVNLNRTGIILDAMAAISKYTLSYAYYDVTLSNKHLRDEESKSMVDLILSTRSYDLGLVYNWGGCFSVISDLFNSSTNNFTSKYAASEVKIKAEINKFIENLA